MRIAGIKSNDITNGQGVCVSLWMQGCPHHCEGCHNPETWSFQGGYEISEEELTNTIFELLEKNNIKRNFSILGGEPLCPQNLYYVLYIIPEVRKKYPDIKIYLWTGYNYEELSYATKAILHNNVDFIIDGKFDINKRDITLELRGSSNQRILKKDIDF